MVYYFYYTNPAYKKTKHLAVSCNKGEIEKEQTAYNKMGWNFSQIYETAYKSFIIK